MPLRVPVERDGERDAQVGGAEVHPEHGSHAAYSRLEMAATADTLSAEYRALTEACGLVDRSERGKLALTGGEAKAFLHGQVTNDIEKLEPGAGCYAAFLTHKGKMLGDLRVLDLGDELLLDTERVALQELFNMIRRYKLGRDVELHKRTVELGLLSVVGPDARRIAGATAAGLPPREHANRRAQVGGADVVLVATDTGIDVLCAAADTAAVRAALEGAGATPVSEAAAEVVRVEHGRPRYGIDLDDSVIPQEAGLNERAVSFTKGCYVGQETVARLFYRGKPNRHLRGIKLSAPGSKGDALRLGEKEVGRLGSVVVSPVHGPIALAIVRREAAPGDTLAVGAGDTTAEIVELPFRDLPLAG
jgi:folate-binding protein YgfZ